MNPSSEINWLIRSATLCSFAASSLLACTATTGFEQTGVNAALATLAEEEVNVDEDIQDALVDDSSTLHRKRCESDDDAVELRSCDVDTIRASLDEIREHDVDANVGLGRYGKNRARRRGHHGKPHFMKEKSRELFACEFETDLDAVATRMSEKCFAHQARLAEYAGDDDVLQCSELRNARSDWHEEKRAEKTARMQALLDEHDGDLEAAREAIRQQRREKFEAVCGDNGDDVVEEDGLI